jgi:hypothetical protein
MSISSVVLALVWAGDSLATPHLPAVRVQRAPVIDGRLDDGVWSQVQASEAFTQKFPDEGEVPGEPTRLWVAYDAQALYVAVDCQQRRGPVVAPLSARDRAVEADWISVSLDTRGDGRGAIELTVNAAGVLADAIRFDDVELSTDWDENWEARTARTAEGWSAELKIPLRILRFATRPVQSWGLQVRRHVSHRQETDEWAYIPRDRSGEVSQYGRLDDLRDLGPGARVEVAPFASARVTSGRRTLRLAGGLDLKAHPSQSLTIDAAVLPDFAEVEADPVVLNLTNFEIAYPEKRRFFLEGIDTFATPEVQLVYTRRIGRVPSPTLDQGEALVDPAPAPIYGAVKLIGGGGGWEVGGLSALTGPSDSQVRRIDGGLERRPGDPLTSFNVLRLKRSIGQGQVGFTGTSVLRPGSGAHVGSLDWRWRGGDFRAQGQLTASLVAGPPRTEPDGTVVPSGALGHSVRLVLSKDGGAHWLGTAWVGADSRDLQINDVGYLDRANARGAGAELAYRTLRPWGPTLETTTRLGTVYLQNQDGLPLERSLKLGTTIRLTSFWTVNAAAQLYARRFDDREIGDGAALERAAANQVTAAAQSDPREPLVARLAAEGTWVRGGGTWHGTGLLLVRPISRLDLELGPDLLLARGEPRYAGALEPGAYLFGRLRARSLGGVVRSSFTVTPRLSLQAYAQLFRATKHYSELTSYRPARPRPRIYIQDLLTPVAPPTSPDTTDSAVNASVVLRWEFRTGSLAYLVYTHAPGLDLGLLKLSYWWG